MTRSSEHTAARRAVARRHHPDVGGDPDVYFAELAAVERRFAPAATTGVEQSRLSRVTRRVLRPLPKLRRKRYFEI